MLKTATMQHPERLLADSAYSFGEYRLAGYEPAHLWGLHKILWPKGHNVKNPSGRNPLAPKGW
jgi:hypothetical protein